jgi:GR25 family glycosyltransferase involved in LPS biosynthesis
MENTKILIINLEKEKDRKEKLEKQLKNYNISNYEFFPAIDGETLEIDPVPLPEQFDRVHLGEKFRKHFSNNEVACLKSHIAAIEYAKELNLDYVTILEDDIILCEDWNDRFNKLMKFTPESWNHIYLSGEPNELEQKTHPLNLAPFLHVEKSIVTMGAFSYVLRNTIYDIVIENLKEYRLPVDDIIKELIIEGILKSYTFYPFLTYHENEFPSSIWDKKIWEQEYYYEHESKRYFVKKL